MTRFPDILHRALFKSFSLLGRRSQGAVLRRYFDWWHRRPDPWQLSTDTYEQHKYQTTLEQLPDAAYRRVLEAGCSEGVFTELLATAYPDADITGVDISEKALERARLRNGEFADRVRFVHADILDHDLQAGFDLVVCAETLYYVGGGDRLRHASHRLTSLLAAGGILVLVHPWPEARRLHRFADAAPGLSKIGERVERDAHRPFSVSLYRAARESRTVS
ncbi:class I SAM-dependent methyltransferase [Nonomuraea turkmeniaca]|uniref:class I SAM-dependent methyltransferase n=1 Tax=Nonomuraea turkmeniaca TaxID=103838 RepID=UPI001476B2F3|nr:SAM-dependent methyltransferase [Nonomuraea turkmeniaca]